MRYKAEKHAAAAPPPAEQAAPGHGGDAVRLGLRRREVMSAGALLSAASLAARPARADLPAAASNGYDDVLDVIIIGAGFAGLTAARDLARAGNQGFLVLEARDRVGGRTLNHMLDGGFISEAGGQWIGPGQTAVADLARELGIDTFDSVYTGNAVFLWGDARVTDDAHGGIDLDPSLAREIDALARQVPCDAPWTARDARALDAISVGDWLAARGVGGLDLLTIKVASLLTAGTGIGTVSMLYYLSMMNAAGGFVALEGQKNAGQQTRFIGGSQALPIRMAEDLGSHVRLSAPVHAITGWDTDVVSVHSENAVYRARQLIMAISPPLCQRIAFTPALPAARAELQARWPAHAPFCKTAMVYDKPFWFDAGYNGQVASADGLVLWSYDNSPPGQEIGVINAFLREGQVGADKDATMREVAAIYAQAMRDDRLLHPREFHAIDWGQEAYTISCMSPMPPGLLTSGLMPALTSACGRIIWAGTETGGIFNCYMDGAVRSGHRAALQALQALRVRA